MVTRWAITTTASAAAACEFTQRAAWFRLLPMGATCRVRSRSTATAGAVQVRHALPQQRRHGCAGRRRLGAPAGMLRRQRAHAESHGAAVSHQRTERGSWSVGPRPPATAAGIASPFDTAGFLCCRSCGPRIIPATPQADLSRREDGWRWSRAPPARLGGPPGYQYGSTSGTETRPLARRRRSGTGRSSRSRRGA